jgi:hypothetical protein
LTRTFTNRGDIIVQGEDELVVNIVDNCRYVTYQLQTHYVNNYVRVIGIALIQKAQCVSRLDELMVQVVGSVRQACGCNTSSDAEGDKASSGPFLMSSISSGLTGNTIHARRVAIFNNPGFA